MPEPRARITFTRRELQELIDFTWLGWATHQKAPISRSRYLEPARRKLVAARDGIDQRMR